MSRVRVPFLLLMALSIPPALRAQCVAELVVGDATGLPGGEVEVQILGRADCEVTGFSLAIGHDPAILSFVSATPGQFLVDHAADELSFQTNSQGDYTVVGALFDITFPLTVPATTIPDQTILGTIRYQIDSGTSPGTTTLLNRTRTYGGQVLVSNIYSTLPGGFPIEPVLVDGVVTVEEAPPSFRRGDANADGWMDISDVVTILLQLFDGRPTPCQKSADADDSGTLSLTDAVFLVDYFFGAGASPPDPLLACSPDPTSDELTCESFAPCDGG